jgi:hypothetical protein
MANTDIGLRSITWSGIGWGQDAICTTMQNVGAELPLVSRRAELAVLAGAIYTAMGGRGEAVLIIGEAGVGKTRLLVEARREAERRGVLVLRGLLTYRRRSSRSPGR